MIDTDGLTQLVDRTVAATRLSPPDPLWPGLAPPAPVTSSVPVDADTAHAEPGARAERVRAFVDATEGLEAAGYCSTLRWSVAFANSAGQTAQAEAADASMDAIARLGTSDGLARLALPRLADLDGAVLGRRAAAKARAGADPSRANTRSVRGRPGGDRRRRPSYQHGLVRIQRQSGRGAALLAELGAGQFDPAVSLVDDPAGASGLALPFDIEGTPTPRSHPCGHRSHERRRARPSKCPTGRHRFNRTRAFPAERRGAPFRSTCTSSRATVAGVAGARARRRGRPRTPSVAELVAQVSHGLLVTDNWYTRVLDPRSLVVTGLTRNGVWLIEDGGSQRRYRTYGSRSLIQRDLVPAPCSASARIRWPYRPIGAGCDIGAPALRLASWQYTGNASG